MLGATVFQPDGFRRKSAVHSHPVRSKLLALAVALQWRHAVSAAGDAASSKNSIVFVCLYGSGKSEIAAAHFNRMARERGLPHTAISRGIGPDPSIHCVISLLGSNYVASREAV
jgi:hypothetical protein